MSNSLTALQSTQLKPYLDTTNTTLCISGSLDENFGKRLVQQLALLKKQKYLSSGNGYAHLG